jgi:Caspase domain
MNRIALAVCLFTSFHLMTAQSKSALLIGIDTYMPTDASIKVPAGAPLKGRFAGGLTFPDLKGPTHDVDAMHVLLSSERFGFPDDDQHIHILRDSAATHDAILAAIRKYVVDEPKAGDTTVLYISSHGSLRVNSKSDSQGFDLDGTGYNPVPLDNTIVPADAYLGAEDVLSRDLFRLFNQAADKGIHLTAIFDACHSGGQARGANDPNRIPRDVAYDPRDLALSPDKNPDGSKVVPPADREINPVLVLSAAQKDQPAIDVQDANPPHGLFTQALVQALQELPPDTAAVDVFRRIITDMEISGANNQQPALDSTTKRKHQPLFGGDAPKGPPLGSVVSVDDDGNVILDIGPASDIGTGSEFTQINAVNGVKAVLRVTDQQGFARSQAELVPQPQAVVRPKDPVVLTKWVPAPRPSVYFYPGVGNLPLAKIRAAAAVLSNAGITLVKDPSFDLWTHILTWNGTAWTLQARKPQAEPGKPPLLDQRNAPPVLVLGSALTADALAKNLPAKRIVWFSPPLPAELAASVLTDKDSAAQLTQDRSNALYIAAGVQNADGLSYAWFERGDYEADVQTPPGYGRGCSPNSPFPLRTDWVSLDGGAAQGNDPAQSLSDSAVKLAKLNGWLKLQSSVTGTKSFPYTLGLQRTSDNQPAEDGGKTYKDELYTFTLNGSIDAQTTPRWVYVLSIDCQGTGQLLWPHGGPGGRFPTDKGRLASIPLPDSTFQIYKPFGTDTYILLTTSTQLPDSSVLSFTGVVKGASRGGSNPLQDLLRSTSTASRGANVPVPTDWSLQTIQTHSQPTTLANGTKVKP